MNILVIGHSLIQEESRKRWVLLAQQNPHLQVTIATPEQWEQNWFGRKKVFTVLPYKKDNYQVVPVRTTDQSNWNRYIIKNLPTLFWQKKPDITLVMQEEFTFCLLWTLLIRKIFYPSTKVLFFSWQNIQIANKKFIKKILWKWVCKETDGMIAGTKQIEEIFRREGYQKPILVQTEIGVDPQRFQANHEKRILKRQELGIEKKFVIGFCGRLIEEKGVLDLIQSCFDLPVGIDWHLLLVGDGQLKEQILMKFHQRNICDRLTITGEIMVDQTVDYYQVMDCFVLPSKTTPHWREQFGLVLAQAMLTNIPTIGSNSGAIPEVIGDENLIFQEGNPKELSNLLQQIIKHPPGEQSIKEKYTTNYLATQLQSFLIQLKVHQ